MAPGVPSRVEAIRPALALLALGGVVVLGEVILLLRDLRRSPVPRAGMSPRDRRPADGVIDIATIPGLIASPCLADTGVSQFLALDEAAAGARSAIATPSQPEEPGALLGRVVVFSLFVGRDGTAWSDEEIARAHRAIERAAAWLEREAVRWGVPVNLEIAQVYFNAADDWNEPVAVGFALEGDHEAPMEVEAVPRAVASASRAASALGFDDLAAMVASVEARVPEADAVVWLVHPRCGGRSIAILPDEGTLPGVSLAICYAQEANFTEPLAGPPFSDPVTIVHELLHLFGATDKYHEPLSSYPRDLVTERDVMCLYYEALPRLRVDRLTALELGWVSDSLGPNRKRPPSRASRRRADKAR